MRIIVLGASGQIGSVIYYGLSKRHQVIGTSRKPFQNYICFDPFVDNWTVLGEADVLINCVGQIEATNSSSFHRIHVDLVALIIKNREVVGNPRIIQISALGASAHHTIEFLKTKGIADELLLRESNTLVVRPSITCTHRTMMVRKMLMLSDMATYTMGLVFIPKGFLKTKLQPVMPQDLVDLVEAMCTKNDRRVVHVVGPEPLTFRDLMALLSQTRNQKFRLVEVPKPITDLVVQGIVSFAFPEVINSQQYQLLFQDNVEDAKVIQAILGRALTPTRQFFIDEFSYGPD